MSAALSVLIPAHNEANYIGPCLSALFASDPLPDGDEVEVLVLANACSDETASIARGVPVPKGWHCEVIEIPEGGKLNALNHGDARAKGNVLVYLDADVEVAPDLIRQIRKTLDRSAPIYASGTPLIAPSPSLISRLYGRFWVRLPFFRSGVPGFGLFAMNRAGRERWQSWPDIIADDMFARLSFAPTERIRLAGKYSWPLVEGFRNLVRVRRRQNEGVAELAQRFPHLLQNEDKSELTITELLRLMRQDCLGFAVYALLSLAVKSPLFPSSQRWTRGR
ncbi:glycosyl transferase, group 2 family protein [Roseobacter sp. SK209-2-6]|uniref:glycosyltransferase family 2 protein n=1 Tax=Roseobacter sp. SK209-2-6 TaxID=388739 RepID=UPI0000F3CE68|nr:glycosyltransferase [Roseobacter sp. SK209-2-6]EBA15971.1 glycosyl transferase, group 2 family protein [Roseobacter sp. SK209-2-6]